MADGWVGGFGVRIMPHCGSILQAETCQILSIAENPRWSREWQQFPSLIIKSSHTLHASRRLSSFRKYYHFTQSCKLKIKSGADHLALEKLGQQKLGPKK